jgi:replicative DNA helicase
LGIEKKRLTIIGGRPSQGKTTILMNILENMMLSNDDRLKDKAGLLFTMEMENESIVENMIASLGKVPNYKIRKGDLDDYEWPKVTNGSSKLHSMNLYLDDRPARTLQDIRAEARRIQRMHKGGIAFIAVDYLQRMGTVEKFDTTSQKVGSFSAGLKRIAQDFDCPVIALAQLNRLGSQRPNKRPSLSDLRDSGEIEQDGDLIMFIHREEYYNKTPENTGKAELIIAKQRKGMCETVHLDSNLHFCRFENPHKSGV